MLVVDTSEKWAQFGGRCKCRRINTWAGRIFTRVLVAGAVSTFLGDVLGARKAAFATVFANSLIVKLSYKQGGPVELEELVKIIGESLAETGAVFFIQRQFPRAARLRQLLCALLRGMAMGVLKTFGLETIGNDFNKLFPPCSMGARSNYEEGTDTKQMINVGRKQGWVSSTGPCGVRLEKS